MLKGQLLNRMLSILDENGWTSYCYHGCFDIAAKKEKLLFLKILTNIDGLQPESAKNLKIISKNLDASPMIIGVQTNRERLRGGIVYERFELPTVCPETFEELISYGIFPSVYRDRGGLYVEIDQEILKEARKGRGLTQMQLAEVVGINKKVIYEHEKCQLRMVLAIAEKIEQVLERKIIKGINPLEKEIPQASDKPADELERSVEAELKRLGFKIDFVKQVPFDIFAIERSLVISDIETNERKMLKRAASLKSFISVVKRPTFIITERVAEKSAFGIPIVKRSSLKDFENSRELIKIAKKSIN